MPVFGLVGLSFKRALMSAVYCQQPVRRCFSFNSPLLISFPVSNVTLINDDDRL